MRAGSRGLHFRLSKIVCLRRFEMRRRVLRLFGFYVCLVYILFPKFFLQVVSIPTEFPSDTDLQVSEISTSPVLKFVSFPDRKCLSGGGSIPY